MDRRENTASPTSPTWPPGTMNCISSPLDNRPLTRRRRHIPSSTGPVPRHAALGAQLRLALRPASASTIQTMQSRVPPHLPHSLQQERYGAESGFCVCARSQRRHSGARFFWPVLYSGRFARRVASLRFERRHPPLRREAYSCNPQQPTEQLRCSLSLLFAMDDSGRLVLRSSSIPSTVNCCRIRISPVNLVLQMFAGAPWYDVASFSEQCNLLLVRNPELVTHSGHLSAQGAGREARQHKTIEEPAGFSSSRSLIGKIVR
jgi:hypothetical protein